MMNADRLPPHDPAEERGLLGCLMLCEEAIDEAVEMFRAGPGGFYDLRHRLLYSAIIDMRENQRPVDLMTVASRLRETGILEDCGGISYVAAHPDLVGSASQIGYYIERVTHKFTLRRLIETCARLSCEAFEYGGHNGELIEKAEREILAINNNADATRGIADMVALHHHLISTYEDASKQKRMGMDTGFPDLDNMTGGMQDQEMIVLAGQQSTGKTSLALNIASSAAFAGNSVGILSIETSAKTLLHRIYSANAKTDGSIFLRGKASVGDFERMTMAAKNVMDIRQRFLIDDTGGLSTVQMRAKARRLRQAGAGLLIIDYLQLMSAPGANNGNERVAAISSAIKAAAKENNCPVIVISSLNREAAKNDRKPRMSDLRDSGQIEYDGNQVWLLSCQNTETPIREVRLEVAKNKDGGTGPVNLTFFAPQFRFESAAKEQPEERRYND
jgi:replicative DNA helicase